MKNKELEKNRKKCLKEHANQRMIIAYDINSRYKYIKQLKSFKVGYDPYDTLAEQYYYKWTYNIIEKYGVDTLRLYEMFLGPLEQSQPLNTKGIDGIDRFLKKLRCLFFNQDDEVEILKVEPSLDEYKVLHKTIKKVTEDIERISFNTAISAFMICVNELSDLKCNKKEILEQLLILLSPFAPEITEELWHLSGNSVILDAEFPVWNEKYI